MTDLPRDLRRTLEATVKAARISAERGAADALRRQGAFDARRPNHPSFTDARNAVRLRLRAHAKSLGDRLDGADGEPLRWLTEATAYVQWHRLLFARFLVERGLLRDEAGVPLSLTDCREEAAMAGGGDEWSIASAHAARLLPGVFPPDDPVESLTLAPEHAKALRDHLRGLDAAIFAADDSLGWTYQFWRSAEKKAVNESQVKIGAFELPAVTQLFTEPYMVRFLLHNTLGAWWAGKLLALRPELARDAADEAALRAACALPGYAWDYLRFVREDDVWRPAAGTFPGWPARAAEITLLDPCCGSGHFLTEALAALAALRGLEDRLLPANAVVAALYDNVHGLEIDGRCVQIAAFALALTAWRISGAGTKLPTPHVAWVGAPPPLPKSEFAALANGETELRRGLEALHDLFAQAPLLGSLIEVAGGDLVNPTRIARIEESIAALVDKMRNTEPERAEGALAARGMADAAGMLARHFVLQATNVPFLGRGKQDASLSTYLAARFESAKADLATAMLQRMRDLATSSGTMAVVTPQNWFFLGSYTAFRRSMLSGMTLNLSIALGEEAWETFGQRGPLTTLSVFSNQRPKEHSSIALLDLASVPERATKIARCLSDRFSTIEQAKQVANPDSRISFSQVEAGPLLSAFADSWEGMTTGDTNYAVRKFWEVLEQQRWRYLNGTVHESSVYSGREHIVLWGTDGEALLTNGSAVIKGREAFGKRGIRVSQMRYLPVTLYEGECIDKSGATIIPKNEDNLPAMWAFFSSPEFPYSVRKLDLKVNSP